MSKHAGILLAAGFSSRMGSLKGALSYAGQTVLSSRIEALYMAGCDPIIIVTGHERERVTSISLAKAEEIRIESEKKHRSYPGISVSHNEKFADGMFTSIQKGVSKVPDESAGFLVLPVDCVRVCPKTIAQVMSAGEKESERTGGKAVVLPSYNGATGHPPWFCISMKDKVMNSNGPLDSLIEGVEREGLIKYEQTDSETILWDMDTPEDYEKMLLYESSLSDDTYKDILKAQGLPERTKAHCEAVGMLAAKWARDINERHPGMMDERLAHAGGLLHDMSKMLNCHEDEGSWILKWHGYDRIADIVKSHMWLPLWDEKTITERELVYAADKVVRETEHVGIKERYRQAKLKCADNPDIMARIEEGENKALRVMKKIEELMMD